MALNTTPTTMATTEFFSGDSRAACRNMCLGRRNESRCRRRCLAGLPDEGDTATEGTAEVVTGAGGGPTDTRYDPNAQAAKTYEELGGAVGQASVQAPAGTLASELGNLTGLPIAATDPSALYDFYLNKQYGAPPGSASQQLTMQYLGQPEKVLGIMGEYPELNVDAVNFGVQLFEEIAGGEGGQLSPHYMITNIVNGVMGKMGEPTPDDVGTDPFGAIANNPNPYDGLELLMSTLRGALTGTMPETALNAYLFNLEQYAKTFISGSGGFMDIPLTEVAAQEGQGQNWFTQMVGQLGPTLGL